jgi:hypothetical protein
VCARRDGLERVEDRNEAIYNCFALVSFSFATFSLPKKVHALFKELGLLTEETFLHFSYFSILMGLIINLLVDSYHEGFDSTTLAGGMVTSLSE